MMLQEIYPRIYRPEYRNQTANPHSFLLYYRRQQILLKRDLEHKLLSLPKFSDIAALKKNLLDRSLYLFSIDEEEFFTLPGEDLEGLSSALWGEASSGAIQPKSSFGSEKFSLEELSVFRSFAPRHHGFAIATGFHIDAWMKSRRFCGICGHKTVHSSTERAIVCPHCEHTEYPRISPAIIVAIRDGDRILLTKRAGSDYKLYALVSGFSEIGETLADTIRREVKEEVGLDIRNIRYYKSQPWGISETMMLAFIADLDGSDSITLQESELSEARWFRREEVPLLEQHISVGQELIQAFREGKF